MELKGTVTKTLSLINFYNSAFNKESSTMAKCYKLCYHWDKNKKMNSEKFRNKNKFITKIPRLQTFSLPVSTFSALGVSHVMHYINLRNLLTCLHASRHT